jgi:hypothetical protein
MTSLVKMAVMRHFPPHRIVCLTEETVETLYLLGEQDRIVGVSGYAVRPPRVRREKPRVSGDTYLFSTPHHSAMNSAVALVDLRNESRSTYSLKPCMAAPVAPKHRLGML